MAARLPEVPRRSTPSLAFVFENRGDGGLSPNAVRFFSLPATHPDQDALIGTSTRFEVPLAMPASIEAAISVARSARRAGTPMEFANAT